MLSLKLGLRRKPVRSQLLVLVHSQEWQDDDQDINAIEQGVSHQ